jgi:Uma2 family endonuclease
MPVFEQAECGVRTHADGRRLWTVEESYRLAELFPGERYELIEGDIISKMGQKPPHASLVAMLHQLLSAAFPGMVRSQSAIRLPEPEGQYSEPEPDIALLTRDIREFGDRHPGPEDIALLIEISDTTFRMDREVKYRLYARAGIPEYWLADIQQRRTFVCSDPAGDEYTSVTIVDAGTEVTSVRAPGFVFCLQDLLRYING